MGPLHNDVLGHDTAHGFKPVNGGAIGCNDGFELFGRKGVENARHGYYLKKVELRGWSGVFF
jgi:hypothetical protein